MNRRPLAAVFLIAAIGCAQPPTHELEIAKARVESARQQDASIFAPELFADAESSLAEALRLAEVERNYLASIQTAAHSTLRANEAFSRASSERTVVIRRLDQLLFELEALLEMAALRGAMAQAPGEIAAFQTRFEAIRTMVEGRELLEALATGTALKQELVLFEAGLRSDSPR